MKPLHIILFVCCFNLNFAQKISPYGRILSGESQVAAVDYEAIPNKLHYADLELIGNGVYPAKNWILTLENTCGNTPISLRLFDYTGELHFQKEYPQIINLEWNANEAFVQFLSDGQWIVIDVETFEERTILNNYPIAVDVNGGIAHFDKEQKELVYESHRFPFSERLYDLEIDKNGQLFAFGRNNYYTFNDSENWKAHAYNSAQFFEAENIEGVVFWVEKSQQDRDFQFELYSKESGVAVLHESQNFANSKHQKQIQDKLALAKTGNEDAILCPLRPDEADYPFPIGNSYAEHQNYGGSPYLHPGVDILGRIAEPIYSSSDGIVKAVLTTGGYNYWRIAIAHEDTPDEQEGYLYAHLAPESIPVSVGDIVKAGDYIGELVRWGAYDFHHLHFARLRYEGDVWDGNWWTVDNVLHDIINFKDDSAPVFEPISNGETIGFKSDNPSINILDSDNLFGQFDIVCHAHDKSNSDWRVDVHSLRFELWKDRDDTEPVYEQHAFAYDFPLDVYDDNIATTTVLQTIYAIGGVWYTLGNYGTREFYQQVSRSDGDDDIDEDDFNTYFDSRNFPDGDYVFRIYAKDANDNESYTELDVVFNNGLTPVEEIEHQSVTIYPNPSSGKVSIESENPITAFKVFDMFGRQIQSVDLPSTRTEYHLNIPESGTYLLRIYLAKSNEIGNTLLLVK